MAPGSSAIRKWAGPLGIAALSSVIGTDRGNWVFPVPYDDLTVVFATASGSQTEDPRNCVLRIVLRHCGVNLDRAQFQIFNFLSKSISEHAITLEQVV